MDQLQASIDQRYPLHNESYVIEAIDDVLRTDLLDDHTKVDLIGWILQRSQELLDEKQGE